MRVLCSVELLMCSVLAEADCKFEKVCEKLECAPYCHYMLVQKCSHVRHVV